MEWYLICTEPANTSCRVQQRALLSPLQDLLAHLHEPVLGLAVGEEGDGSDGLVHVLLG